VSLKLRARLAMRLIGWARALLRMPATANEDFDTCVHCKAPGCEDGSADHAPDCPSVTGVQVVTLQEMWPAGPAVCEDCETTLWPGDSYLLIELSPSVFQVACLGCVARHELLGGPA
jgi:hypothetical protein